MNYFTITEFDINNGLGFRLSLWISGCPIRCAHCHNPELWDDDVGSEFNNATIEEILDKLKHPLYDGVSILGGEPLQLKNPGDTDMLLKLCKAIKSYNPCLNIWIFSGYTWEELITRSEVIEILKYVKVLVDGRYKHEYRDTSLAYRGSSNQRLIDVQASLNENKIVLYNI